MYMIRLLAAVSLLLASTVPALAQVRAQEDDDSKKSRSSSYWATVFQGGMLVPLGTMEEAHQSSLAGGLRVGWIGKSGLGLDVAAEYSPLARKRDVAGDTFETHFVTASVMPRFTLGKKMVRLWLAAGGGLAYEHSQQTGGGMTVVMPATHRYAAAGVGAAGVELHLLSGAGLAVVGSYTRTYGQIDYEVLNVTGGLVFTFR